MIFSRRKTLNRLPGVRFFRHTTTPGIKIGRYESGLEAVWAWQQHAHLLVVERENYGAGENLVRQIARTYDGERSQVDPKEYRFRNHQPWMFMTSAECASELARLGTVAQERAGLIEDGEEIKPMLVTIPELHDVVDRSDHVGKQMVNGLGRLLRFGRAGRVHVLANIRQGYFYKAYLPQELLNQFSAHLVLGKTSRLVTERLDLPYTFDRPHGRLGDLGDGFWPLEVRRR